MTCPSVTYMNSTGAACVFKLVLVETLFQQSFDAKAFVEVVQMFIEPGGPRASRRARACVLSPEISRRGVRSKQISRSLK